MLSPRDTHVWFRDPPAGSAMWPWESGRLTAPDPEPHHHPPEVVAIHLVESGRGLLTSPHERLTLGPGSLFCFQPGLRWEYHGLAGDPWVLRWLVLRGSGAQACAAACGFSLARASRPPVPAAMHCFAGIHRLMARRGAGDAHAVVALLHELAAVLAEPGSEPAQPDLVAAAARLLAVGRYDFSVAQVAEALVVSTSTFARACRRAGYANAMDFLDTQRLEHARELIATSGWKMSAIARDCGFASSQYLARRFRRRFGCIPSVLRQDDDASK